MKKIFLKQPLTDTLILTENEYNYLKNTLRLGIGDKFNASVDYNYITSDMMNGGTDATTIELALYSITNIKNTTLTCQKTESYQIDTNKKHLLVVYQCLAKREYMDTLIEKYTELGVDIVIPVSSKYSTSEVKPNTERRLKEIIANASAQCERPTTMILHKPTTINNIKPMINGDNIVFYERHTPKSIYTPKTNSVAVVIGAEGGFSEDEVTLLQNKGFTLTSPLQNILKAETAGVALTGMIKILLENR